MHNLGSCAQAALKVEQRQSFLTCGKEPHIGRYGRGMAIAGIVLGVISIMATVVLILVFVVLVHGLANNTATF